MAKQVIKISPSLTDDAHYRAITDVPQVVLNSVGSTLRFYPGTYAAASANLDGVAIEGVGSREDVIINSLTLGIGGANTVAIRGVTLNTLVNTGNANLVIEDCLIAAANDLATLGSAGIENGEAGVISTGTVAIRRSRVSQGDIVLLQHSEGDVDMSYVHAIGADRGMLSNANARVEFCNFGANAYFTPGGTASYVPNVTTVASSGGANTGNTTETVTALIS